MTIAAVGTAGTSYSSTASTTSYTVSHTNSTAGNYLILTVDIGGGVTSDPVTGVSGGGVTTWTRAISYAIHGACDIWYGKITTTGSHTTTVSTSSTQWGTLCAEEFSTTLGTLSFSAYAVKNNSTSSTTVSCPSMTPSSGTMLYVGTAVSSGTSDYIKTGSTSGYTYVLGGTSSYEGGLCYDVSVSAATTPSFTQSGSTTSMAASALFYEVAAGYPTSSFMPFFNAV